MGPTDLEAAIFRTVAWFSLFSYPLTTFETWKWMMSEQPFALADVDEALAESAWLSERLAREGAFIGVHGAPLAEQISERQTRFLDAVRKFAKLKRATRWFSALPSVRAVAACNTLAWHHTTAESDIDLFILVKPGTIWATRLLLVTPFALLGRRPTTEAVAQDPFCFSFFVTSERLCLERLQLSGGDPYLAMWTRSIVPVFDRDNAFAAFAAQNGWAKREVPHASLHARHEELSARETPGIVPGITAFEPVAKRVQSRRLPVQLKHMANRDSRVIVTDEMLKFHENDRREFYRERWKEITGRSGGS
jgi:hypothetical protein